MMNKKIWRILLLLFMMLITALAYFWFGYLVEYTTHQETDMTSFSNLSICTSEGKSFDRQPNPDGTFLYIVPDKLPGSLFVCGSVESPTIVNLRMYIFEDENEKSFAFSPHNEQLKSGPFRAELIALKKLKYGIYRVELQNGRFKIATIRLIVKSE
jgi:hypothetical protein